MTEIIPEKKIRLSLLGVVFIALSIISLILFIDHRINNNDSQDVPLEGKVEDPTPEEPNKNIVEDRTENQEEDPEVEKEPEEPADISELTYSGWIPIWDFTNAIDNINRYEYSFDSISPVWFGVQQDGSLLDRRTSSSSLISTLDDEILIIPTISAFDPDIMQDIFSDDVKFNRHVTSIVTMVEVNDFDGIDLDYEVIYIEDKPGYMRLIKEIGERLHAKDKILSITVLSQWGAKSYSSFPETRAVQDYVQISKYADEIRIMCYDYTSISSGKPGPIGPIDWINSVLDYATSIINSRKIVLGVHLYGYRWNQDGLVTATTYDQMDDVKNSENYEYLFNYSYDEGVAEYAIGGNNYTHFFQTEEGVISRAQLAAEYNIKGVIFWRLGRESSILDSLLIQTK